MRQRRSRFQPQCNSRSKSKAEIAHAGGEQPPIYTYGRVFEDGASIELTHEATTGSLCLLVSAGDDRRIAREVEFRGRLYRPVPINPSLLMAMQFPTECSSFGSTTKLFKAIRETFMSRGFPEEITLPLPYFVFSTCFTQFLLAAPCLLISGPPAESRLLLQLLACMVFHALPLCGLTASGFCSLPLDLYPTLLINQERISGPLWELLSASNRHNAFVPWRGGLLNILCAKAIYCGDVEGRSNLGDGTLQICLPPFRGRLPFLHAKDQEEITVAFQSKFLAYRCQNITKVRTSQCDFPEFDSSIRILGQILGAPIVDAPELQADLRPLLREYQERAQSARWLDLRCVTSEAVLHHCHKDSGKKIHIGEVTETVNAILKGRGETTEYTPEVIGGVLRQHGFRPKRDSKGYAILLDDRTRRHAHLVAQRFDVAAVQEGVGKCSLCTEILARDEAGC